MDLEREDVDDILKILDSTPYDRLNVSTERFNLKLVRTADAGWQGELNTLAEADIHELEENAGADNASSAQADVAGDIEGQQRVNAPLPGTFYRAPRPGADPFIEVGDTVEPDTVVCIVETMKLMNSVKAGCSGTVTRILIDNGAMVEQGAAMLLVETGADGS